MAVEQALDLLTLPANADLSAAQYKFVDLNSSGNLAVAADGGTAIGVLQNKPAAAARPGTFCKVGDRTKVLLGGTLTPGARVASGGTGGGRAVAALSGERALGIIVQGGADGEIGSMIFSPEALLG